MGTKDSNIRKSGIEQGLLAQGIDSVLKAAKYSRENIEVEIDTIEKSSLHEERENEKTDSYLGKLIVKHIFISHKILNSSKNAEEGLVFVSADGSLCCLPSNLPGQNFSFTKTSKYTTTFDYSGLMSNEPKSFWDSTVKPILVTLGAVAVIALFFLVRG